MRPAVRDELLRINRAFYQKLALSFAATRARPQPGVVRALAGIDVQASVFDAGCGHGLAARRLAEGGHRGPYLGVDASERLIDLARQRVEAPWAKFRVGDFAEPGWQRDLLGEAGHSFDWALAFAVLHHLPGEDLRSRVVDDLRSLLPSGGRAAVSVWDFAQSDRLRARVVDWASVGLQEGEVDPGDALIDWRHEGRGIRYVHLFTPEDLADLASRSGFTVLSEYRSDGQGGRMGLYQVWCV